MLSYRHAFHAGNFADVLKHSVLHYVLSYMNRKEKAYSYIDSHSGAGMYRLTDDYAQKTGEYKQGIEKLINEEKLPVLLQEYVDLIQSFNDGELAIYPGSPAVAQANMRRQDSAHLFELHKTDHGLLAEFCQRWRKANVNQSDGYKGVNSQLPPPSRRGIVLIDPPYELKDDYVKAINTIIKGYKKFATGTYIVWYPVVKRHFIDSMEQLFINSDLRNILQVEFCQQPDSDEYGMTGTGLFIVNPPWQLQADLEIALPILKSTIGNDTSSYSLKRLIDE